MQQQLVNGSLCCIMLPHLLVIQSCSTVWCQWLMYNSVLCGYVQLMACQYTPLLQMMMLVRQQDLLSSVMPLPDNITCWYVTQCSQMTLVDGPVCLLLTVSLFSGLSSLSLCLRPHWWVVSSFRTCPQYHIITTVVHSTCLLLTIG